MNNTEKIIEVLTNIWKENPDLRLGQIISNSIPHCGVMNDYELYLFNYQDEQMVSRLNSFLNKIKMERDNK